MPDGSHGSISSSSLPHSESSPKTFKSGRARRAGMTENFVPLVGNATGLMFRLQQIEDELTALDHSGEPGRHTYPGRALQRQAAALVNLAIELTPVNTADCMAIISAAYEKIGDVYREEREAKEMRDLLEAPMDALSRVALFLAPEIGLRVEDFAHNYTCIGDLA